MTTPIEIHGNLNKRLMSVRVRRSGERVSHHLDVIAVVDDVTFRVRPAGHRRATGTREVCAHVVGELDSIEPMTRDIYAGSRDYVQITYDPKNRIASSTARTRLAVYVPRAVL
jgi:hypothetical protein